GPPRPRNRRRVDRRAAGGRIGARRRGRCAVPSARPAGRLARRSATAGGDALLFPGSIGRSGGEDAADAREHREDPSEPRARRTAQRLDRSRGEDAMTCDAFERWLEDDRPEADRADALLHTRECRRCAAALRAVEAIESTLAAPPAAPGGFADRVMVRVAVTPQRRPFVPALDAFPLAPALPWWVRAAFEPACVLATVVVAVLLWQGTVLSALVAALAQQLVAWLSVSPALTVPMWVQPMTLAGAGLAAAPLVFMLSQQLYHWSADLFGPRHAAVRAR